jgi:hypothetical protein
MEDTSKYDAIETERVYVLQITKNIAVRARSEREATQKVFSGDYEHSGKISSCKVLGKLKNTKKEID